MRTALVTGGARGLGREICLALGREGYKVAVNYMTSGEQAQELLGKLPEGSIAIKADVGEPGDVSAMAETLKAHYGRLDAMVNNAGAICNALLVKTTPDEWDRVMRTNLGGPFNTIRALAPLMAETGGGIVNVSSYSAQAGMTGLSAYSASKAALLGLTRVAAQELAMYNIRVNAIFPGYMATEMGMSSPAAMEAAKGKHLLGRLSDPAETASFVAFILASPGVTGQVFPVEGRII